MDYKYIEQLVERYFACDTTELEEQILRKFFLSDEMPEHLAAYKDLFRGLQEESNVELPADFDDRFRQKLPLAKGKVLSLRGRIASLNKGMKPFYKAVASVALVITVGVTSSQYWSSQAPEPVEYNYASYHETYSDPKVACEKVADALKSLSDALRGDEVIADSTGIADDKGEILKD